MYPILVKLGPVTLYSYGVMLAVAFLVSLGLARRAARRLPPALRAISAEQLADLITLSLLGGIVGGRLFYVMLSWKVFVESPAELLAIWHGGLVWYGGFLGGVLAAWLYVRAQRLRFLRVGDQVVPFLALGHAIGRIGCFLNGCCFGDPTNAWCGVVFPGASTPVLPTQLFEALGLFVLFLILRRLQEPAMLRRPGRLLGWYVAGYAGWRFLLEFIRGDQTPWWMGLTLQQLISLILLVVGLSLLGRPPRRTPA